MKQFLRYLLLIGCVFLLSTWGLSIFRYIRIGYGDVQAYGIMIFSGQIGLAYTSQGSYFYQGFVFYHHYNRYSEFSIFNKLGLILPYYDASFMAYMIPIWLLLLPLAMFTLFLWYPKIKAWRQGTNRKGFEVEIREDVKEP